MKILQSDPRNCFLLLLVFLIGINTRFVLAEEDPKYIFELLQGNQFEEALTQADDLATQFPDNPEYQFLRALVLDKSSKTDAAIAAYRQMIEVFPDFPESYNNLAILLAYQGDYPGAVETLELAFTTNENYSIAYRNLQSIYNRMASDSYRQALNIDSPLPALELSVIDKLEFQTSEDDVSESKVQATSPEVQPDKKSADLGSDSVDHVETVPKTPESSQDMTETESVSSIPPTSLSILSKIKSWFSTW